MKKAGFGTVAFADRLEFYVSRSAYTAGQLAGLADLPRTTIVNWLNGRVERPRDWQPVVRLLAVLHLEEREADEVLRAAKQPAIGELRLIAQGKDRELLSLWERPSAPTAPPYRPPFQAVADTPYFVGREEILAALRAALLGADDGPICVLQGMAGTGKTAVAARIAYQLRAEFPDGVLWARLDTSETMVILHTFAQAYGADVSQYADTDSRSRVVRDLLADRRALIVLDNATGSGEVEPLLPPTGRCAVLVTTRRHDLRVAQGANRFTLRPFGPQNESGQQLFAHFLGAERAVAEADLLAEIAELAGHLPLALTIAAGRLAYEPGWSTADFLARLQQERRRLKELQSEDQSVRLSFEASYALAPAAVQDFFATLCRFGGEDFSPEAAGAGAGVETAEAEDYLRMLFRLSLVQAGRAGRYRLHPLLRDYGRELLGDSAGWTGLAAYYTDFLGRHQLGDGAAAREMENITAVLAGARQSGETAVGLVLAFAPFLKVQGLYEPAEGLLRWALETAGARQRAAILVHLSQIARFYRRYDEADGYLDSAEPAAQAQEDMYYLSAIEGERGIVAACRGDYGGARTHFERGLGLAREHRRPGMLVPLLKEMGAAEVARGNYETAEGYYEEALALAQDSLPALEPALLRCLGGIAIVRDGDFGRAGMLYEQGLDKARVMNGREDMVTLLNNLAAVAHMQGEAAEAESLLSEGLGLARRLRYQVGMGMIAGNLGRLAMSLGEWAAAEAHLQEGLAVAAGAGHHELIIGHYIALGLLAAKRGEVEAAREALETAVSRAREIGYRSGVVQGLVVWGWLEGDGAEFLGIFETLKGVYGFEGTAAEFVAGYDVAAVGRLKIFYD